MAQIWGLEICSPFPQQVNILDVLSCFTKTCNTVEWSLSKEHSLYLLLKGRILQCCEPLGNRQQLHRKDVCLCFTNWHFGRTLKKATAYSSCLCAVSLGSQVSFCGTTKEEVMLNWRLIRYKFIRWWRTQGTAGAGRSWSVIKHDFQCL